MPANAVSKQVDAKVVICEDTILVILADKTGMGGVGGVQEHTNSAAVDNDADKSPSHRKLYQASDFY